MTRRRPLHPFRPVLLGLALCTPPGVPGALWAQLAPAAPPAASPTVSPGGAPPSHAARPKMQPVSRDQPVTFNADRVEYDRDHGLVTATGHVEAWQNDHVLRADTITFDRNRNVVAARGHVAVVEPDGEVLFADYAELSQGMRDGVLRGMRAILADNGKLVANGARRTDAKINEMSHAIYSTCNLCATDPSQPPLWQLRAYSATQDTEHKTIEYQDAYLDMFGVPVFYLPYFSHADPSVKRQSGFLVPSFGGSRHLGEFLTVPYYLVTDPQSDLVLAPTAASKGLANLDTIYRRRFNNGNMTIDLSFGNDRNTNAASNVGHTSGGFEGAVFAKGQFAIDDEWRYGFDLNRTTSRDYIRDYRLPDEQDVLTSQVYLEGFGAGSYSRLDARAYQGLTDSISQSNLPFVLPRYQYSFSGEPDAWGGRTTVDAGAFNIYRENGTRDQRTSVSGDWIRPFQDELGQLYSVDLHLDAAAYNATQLNQAPNFATSDNAAVARALPQVALNYRWPVMRNDTTTGTQVIEPIVQLIGAPNTGTFRNTLIPNEDSLDFEFSDANLFSFNRFPGIDRLEGGERANYAMHATWQLGDSALDGLIGQSYRIHRDDTYPIGSGLNGNASDIVARTTFTPTNWLDVTYRTRLDHDDLKIHMADAVVTVGRPIFRVTGGYTYENVDPYYLYDQATVPASYFVARNEATLGASSQVGHYKVTGYAREDVKNNQLVAVGAMGSYEDECFIFSVNLNRRYTSIDNDHGDTTVLFQITFKTVGQVGYHAS